MTHDVHPDLARAARWLPRFSFTRRSLPLLRLALRLSRPFMARGGDVRVERETTGAVPMRVYVPANRTPRGALLWMHGGGMIVGTPSQDDARSVRFVRELGIVVVSPAYRLAPKYPFPAALEDCYAAWRWMIGRSDALGIDPEHLAVGGESAGGGLAASLAQRIRDDGGPGPAAQLLVYPMLDDRTANDDGSDGSPHLVWNRRSNRTGWSSYLGGAPGAPEVPQYAVPARCEDLSGLPAAWIGVGTADLFFRENSEYARRLEAAGVPCHFRPVDGGFHGFQSLAPRSPVSLSFTESQLTFLREQLGL